jgi:hypothetical protein
MSGDPMRLVKFMCAAKGHSTARSDSALTIHDGVWAFCYAGGQTPGHDWKPVDGLPLNDAMRFAQAIPATPLRVTTPAAAKPPKARKTVATPKDRNEGQR